MLTDFLESSQLLERCESIKANWKQREMTPTQAFNVPLTKPSPETTSQQKVESAPSKRRHDDLEQGELSEDEQEANISHTKSKRDDS
jgi:hypothetical protein